MASSGGAIFLIDSENLIIIDTNFTDNTASVYGGALFLRNTNNITISSTIFVENKANEGGALLFFESHDSTISYTNFT